MENKKIPFNKDKRVKLSIEQREEIYQLYQTGCYSQRVLAEKYGVSRRLISLYVDKERLEQHKEKEKNKNYYDKDKNTIYHKKYRERKKTLMLSGQLI